MSFGSSAPEPTNVDVYFERVFTHGVRNLRSGLGAVFVKAAGNAFRDCASLERDVKHILARSARRIDPEIAVVSEMVGTVSRDLRLAWTDNAAGYGFHNWYGFGAVDLDAALEMAEDYTPESLGEFRETFWFEQATSVDIPDNDGTGVMQTLNVSGLPDDASIEAVLLEVDIEHEFPNDLGIHLVSPGGTRSVVNQVFNETLAVKHIPEIRWRLLSNAFYGETPNGDWQIEVFDAAEDDTGDLEAWRLKVYYGSHPEEEDEGGSDADDNNGGDGASTG